MGDAAMRTALVAYLKKAAIPGVTQWFADMPWRMDLDTWSPSGLYGAWGYVHIDNGEETRITVPAIDGNKRVDYTISFIIAYKYAIPQNTPQGSEDAWVGPLDAIIDGFKTAVRADPNAGDPSVVWQWGQDENGIKHQRDLPVKSGRYIQSWNRIEVHATQIITA